LAREPRKEMAVMEIELLSDNSDSLIRITEESDYHKQYKFCKLLDHAWVKKINIEYDQAAGTLMAHLRRYNRFWRALGTIIWCNAIEPTIHSTFTIREIDHCEIWDDDPHNPHREEVILGRLVMEEDNTLFLGAYCEH
jgi:hypothetical protein